MPGIRVVYGDKHTMIDENDLVKIFKDKTGRDVVFGSSPISEGDTVMVIPSKNSDDIVIKNGPIREGDYVGIVPVGNGDYIIIKPGGCAPVDLGLVKTWLSTHRSYSYRLAEDFIIKNRSNYPQLNLKIDFIKKCLGGNLDNPTIPQMYPCGAVWLGLGSPDTYGEPGRGTWLYRLWPNPYATLGLGMDMDIRTGESAAGVTGGMGELVQIPSGEGYTTTWCVPNFLYYYTAGNWNPFINFTVRYLHVHIRNTATLFFGGDGHSVSSIGDIKVCKGEPGPGWCGGAFDEGE
jgi:hypothetical protein